MRKTNGKEQSVQSQIAIVSLPLSANISGQDDEIRNYLFIVIYSSRRKLFNECCQWCDVFWRRVLSTDRNVYFCLLSFAFCSERSALRLTPIHSCFPYGMRSVGHGWMESLSEMQSGRVNRSERFHCDFCDRQMAYLFRFMRLLVVDRQWVSGGLSFSRVAIRRVSDISKDSEMLNYSSSLLKFLIIVDQSLSTHNLEPTTSADSSKIRFCSLIPRPNQYFDRQREIRHCGKLCSAGKELGN